MVTVFKPLPGKGPKGQPGVRRGLAKDHTSELVAGLGSGPDPRQQPTRGSLCLTRGRCPPPDLSSIRKTEGLAVLM